VEQYHVSVHRAACAITGSAQIWTFRNADVLSCITMISTWGMLGINPLQNSAALVPLLQLLRKNLFQVLPAPTSCRPHCRPYTASHQTYSSTTTAQASTLCRPSDLTPEPAAHIPCAAGGAAQPRSYCSAGLAAGCGALQISPGC
jgi:hypothetical protein